MLPSLVVHLEDREWTRLAPPEDLGARAWLLAVVAVQLTGVEGQVRAHLTGRAQAKVHPFDQSSTVHVSLGDSHICRLPPMADLGDFAARIELFHDAVPIREVVLERLARSPTPRAFGHVFCRYLRSGEIEPGYDLTEFISQPAGAKYQRVVQQPLAVGHTVSYRITL